MPKRNVYFSDDDVKLWDNLPEGMRSRLLRDFLIEHENIRSSGLTREDRRRELLRGRIRRHRDEVRRMEDKSDEYGYLAEGAREEALELEEAFEEEFGFYPAALDIHNETEEVSFDLWDTILAQAEHYALNETIFTSPSGRNRYRIQGVKKGKIMVERMDTNSKKPSTFTVRTIEKAVERLKQAGGGKIRRGHFMPVIAQECAAVELHPSLRYEEDWLILSHEGQVIS